MGIEIDDLQLLPAEEEVQLAVCTVTCIVTCATPTCGMTGV
ncbi:ALQxL family class IV lanthipeptide [Streptomyces chartreusis]